MAEVSYGMDHAALLVWIDNNARSERELTGRLCRRHADSLVVPRGWTIDDRRDPIPRLFRSIAEDVDAAKSRSRRHSEPRGRGTPAESPSLFEGRDDEIIVEEHSVAEPTPEPHEAAVDTHVEITGDSTGIDDEPAVEDIDMEDDAIDVIAELEYEPIDDGLADIEDLVTDEIFAIVEPIDEPIDEPIEEVALSDDDDDTDDDDDANDETDPDATQAMPWTPQLTGRYSPDETGPVSGRLLGRAFGVRKDDE
jgi:hypothetical protein